MANSMGFITGKLGIEHEFAYQTQRTLVGLTALKKEGGWLLVIKTRRSRGEREVAFVGASSLDEAFEVMWEIMATKPGLRFRPDLYQSTVSDSG